MESTIRLCCSTINDILQVFARLTNKSQLSPIIDSCAYELVARDDQPRKGRENDSLAEVCGIVPLSTVLSIRALLRSPSLATSLVTHKYTQ